MTNIDININIGNILVEVTSEVEWQVPTFTHTFQSAVILFMEINI